MKQFDLSILSRVNPHSENCTAEIRALPEHFKVTEILPFSPDDEGTHALLLIEKKDTNTDWIAKQLALFAKVPEVAVGYAGKKDRHAITTQWFSVNLEGHEEPDWHQFNTELWTVKQIHRHRKKLKRGVLKGNHFELRLTQCEGDKEAWLQNLQLIKNQGIPNYFGQQRFGHNSHNLKRVDDWFSGGRAPKKRHLKSLYLSAARSWLFNLVLSRRVSENTWNSPLLGDMMLLAGTQASLFKAELIDATLIERIDTFDIHPTGPLWGRGEQLATDESALIENAVLDESWQDWIGGLERAGLQQERRALRMIPENFQWAFEQDDIILKFSLPSGCFATALLRELGTIEDVAARNSE